MTPKNKSTVLSGDKFGKLTIIDESLSIKGQRYFVCLCDCGTTKTVRLSHLKQGYIVSCGCFRLKRVKEECSSHNLTRTPIYNVWSLIKRRCYNSKCKNFKDYGGRGITMCQEWKDDFLSFYNWVMQNNYSKGLQINRIDNNGNYEPENCEFTTPKINSRNKRNNRIIEHDGQRKTLVEWSEIYNINQDLLGVRLNIQKLSFKEAVSKILNSKNKKRYANT